MDRRMEEILGRYKSLREHNAHDWMLRSKYKITTRRYHAMLDAQGGRCAICKQIPSNARFAVDHCHRTNRVRGLLCGKCNIGLGAFGDSAGRLKNAILYLNRRMDSERLDEEFRWQEEIARRWAETTPRRVFRRRSVAVAPKPA